MNKILSFVLAACLFSTASIAQKSTANAGSNELKAIPSTTIAQQTTTTGKAITEFTYVNAALENAIGFGANQPIDVRGYAYFPADVVTAHQGESIRKINVSIVNEGANTANELKVCIWTDTTNAGANPAYEQTVSTITSGWNEVTLTTPYVLGTTPVFIGYKVKGTGFIIHCEKKATAEPNGYGDMLVQPTGKLIHLASLGGTADFGDLGIKAFVGNPDAVNVKLTNIDTEAYLPIGEADIKGTIKNIGGNAITSYDVTYKIDGGTASAVYSVTGVNIAPEATANFTHNVKANFAASGEYNVAVTIANVNGGGETSTDDNTLSKQITVMNEIYTRNVVYEEGTGTWCGWCPRGHVGLNTMAHNVTDGTWIGIAAHSGDPMAIAGYATSLNFGGYPSGRMNRGSSEVDPGLADLQAAFNIDKVVAPIAKIDISNQSWNKNTRDFTAEVTVNFALDKSDANYNVALIVLEDSVRGTAAGYAQANYYAANNLDLVDWDGTNWKDLGNPVPAANMYYNHVARQLIGGFAGVSGAIPAAVTYNTPYTHTFNGNIPADNKAELTHFVALIIDNSTKQIVNAIEKELIITDGIITNSGVEFNIYPNPSTGVVRIDDVEGAQIMVYNMLGEVVYNNPSASATTVMNLSDLQAGNYIVRMVNGQQVSTQKIILTK